MVVLILQSFFKLYPYPNDVLTITFCRFYEVLRTVFTARCYAERFCQVVRLSDRLDLLQRTHPQILAGIGVGWGKLSIFDI